MEATRLCRHRHHQPPIFVFHTFAFQEHFPGSVASRQTQSSADSRGVPPTAQLNFPPRERERERECAQLGVVLCKFPSMFGFATCVRVCGSLWATFCTNTHTKRRKSTLQDEDDGNVKKDFPQTPLVKFPGRNFRTPP